MSKTVVYPVENRHFGVVALCETPELAKRMADYLDKEAESCSHTPTVGRFVLGEEDVARLEASMAGRSPW